MAFVDDCTAWVAGPSAERNRAGLQRIIDRAMKWEKRSGATFEGDKTVLVHFTRHPDRTSTRPMVVKGRVVRVSTAAKILGVVMDSKLRYTQHVANVATNGINAVMALKRLRGLSPRTVSRLFEATIAPVMDFASNACMLACGCSGAAALNRAQKAGA